MNYPEINVTELYKKIQSDEVFLVLDVREPFELEYARIQDKRVQSIPLSMLAENGINALPPSMLSQDIPVFVMCHHGVRSVQATQWLQKHGYPQFHNVSGGIDEYARKVDPSVGIY